MRYLPAESDTGMFGGNSNWRGPVWIPMNLVILRGLHPAASLLRRSAQGASARRARAELNLSRSPPSSRAAEHDVTEAGTDAGRCQRDREVPGEPHWRELLLFHEYFHGDDGAARRSHQTGWTGAVALLLELTAPWTNPTPSWRFAE